jgi:hypothetical protein
VLQILIPTETQIIQTVVQVITAPLPLRKQLKQNKAGRKSVKKNAINLMAFFFVSFGYKAIF